MPKSSNVTYQQLRLAINYMIGLLEEGSLVPRYDESTRIEIAIALNHLLHKVDDLPENVPDQLVQAATVRSVIEAAEGYYEAEQAEMEENLELHMREAEAAASIHGHILSEWVQVTGSEMEYQATCQICGGFVYVSFDSTYNLLLDSCERIHID